MDIVTAVDNYPANFCLWDCPNSIFPCDVAFVSVVNEVAAAFVTLVDYL